MAFRLVSRTVPLVRRLQPGTTQLAPTTARAPPSLPASALRAPLRALAKKASSPGDSVTADEPAAKGSETPAKPRGFLERLLASDATGESPVLRLMGYYTPQSKAIGAANSLYAQVLRRARSAVDIEFPESQRKAFLPQYEMAAVHIYLTLRRLRFEKGSPHESGATVAMQCLFDLFWTDVRTRMMMAEHELTILESSKWIKQCERNFFAMALNFDDVWDDDSKMIDAISTHITSFNQDKQMLFRLRKYMKRERIRLDKLSIDEMWEGISWQPNYPTILN